MMEAALTFCWHDTQAGLDEALVAACAQPRRVLVSARLPLLADLTVAENIALPRSYHLNVNAALALLQAREFVARLLPPERALAYPGELTPVETFAALWLRAVAVPGNMVILESPLTAFDLSEGALRDSTLRCHGLFDRAIAHERRTQTSWSTAA